MRSVRREETGVLVGNGIAGGKWQLSQRRSFMILPNFLPVRRQLAVLPVFPSHAQPSLQGLPVILCSEALYTVNCHPLRGNVCSLWLP